MIRWVCAAYVLIGAFSAAFSQDKLRGLAWEDEYYNNLPLKVSYFRVPNPPPASYSIKNFCPRIINQSSSNTGVAWASVWYARTMQEAMQQGWRDEAIITHHAYSPAFNYRFASESPGCNDPVKLSAMLESLHHDGAVSFSDFTEFCADSVSAKVKLEANANKLPGYVRLFYSQDTQEKKINAIREAISESHPVVLGIICPPTFSLAGEFWQPRSEADRNFGGHAVTVVGYNDAKYGGAIEIVNSWYCPPSKPGCTARLGPAAGRSLRRVRPLPSRRISLFMSSPRGQPARSRVRSREAACPRDGSSRRTLSRRRAATAAPGA